MNEVLRASMQTGGAAVVAMVLGVITVKIMAMVMGPEGVGLYALLQQVQLTALALASFGGGTALVQGVASESGRARDEYLATTVGIFAAAVAVVALVLLLGAPWLNVVVTGHGDGIDANLIRWLIVPVALGVLYAYLTGVIIGFRAVGRLAVIKVAGSLATALVAYPVFRLAHAGSPIALIGLMTAAAGVPAVLGCATAWRAGWFSRVATERRRLLTGEAAKHFFKIAGSMLIIGQLGSVALLAILAAIQRAGGLQAVGIFNAAWSLSMTYVMLVLASFSTYYLPALSRAHEPPERDLLMRNVFRLTIFTLIPLITAMVVLKPWIITTLYSAEFLSSITVVRWMLIGDYIKVTSWVVCMPALAYADMKVWLATDASLHVGFYTLSALSLRMFGSTEGVGIVFCALYVPYLIFYLVYARRKFDFRVPAAHVRMWWGGLLIIVGASITTWTASHVNWPVSALWVTVALVFSLLTLTAAERKQIAGVVTLRLSEVRH